MKRTGSKKGSRAGSVRSLTFADDAGMDSQTMHFTLPYRHMGVPQKPWQTDFKVMFALQA